MLKNYVFPHFLSLERAKPDKLLGACHRFLGRFFILLAVLLPGSLLFSQQSGEEGEAPVPLEVKIETSPAAPAVNSPWTLSVLVNHPNPREVNIKPPQFPSSLALERIRTDIRLLDDERWTRVEFLFTPLRTGAITIGSFEVSIPGEQAVTAAIDVRFQEEAGAVRRYNPRFRWVSPASSVYAGEKKELTLELSNWDPSINVPSGIFRGRAPRSAVLEEKPPVEAGEGTYRYEISIIPLEESRVVLEPFSFNFNTYSLNIPGIIIPVLPAASPVNNKTTAYSYQEPPRTGTEHNEDAGSSSMNEISHDGISARPFPVPENRGNVFFPLSGEYSRICDRVRVLWENNRRAEALAEIRRNERDSLCGPFLVPLRRAMEQALSLGFTDDERWRPLKIPLPAWVTFGLFLLFLGILLFVFRKRLKIHKRAFRVRPFGPYTGRDEITASDQLPGGVRQNEVPVNTTSRFRGSFISIIIVILCIGLVLIFLEEETGNFLISRLNSTEKTAVLERTTAYRVPDLKGAVNARFGEGQPVIIGAYHSDWCYAESLDGRSGWVKREEVISY